MGKPIYLSRPAHCLNCGFSFTGEENFCPSCGQKRKDPLPKLKELILDFLGDFFTFDSKLMRSVGPLFVRPGSMTREYIEGKQARYIPPLRMFLFLSVVMVISLNYFAKWNNWSSPIQFGGDYDQATLDSLLTSENAISLQDTSFHLTLDTYQKIKALEEKGLSYRSIADTILPEGTLLERMALQQALRVERGGSQAFTGYLIGNTTFMLFSILLLLAALMGVVFYRHKLPFMAHLIYAFHFHSFGLILLLVVLLLVVLLQQNIVFAILPIALYFYHLKAIQVVYQRTWLKALLVGTAIYLTYLLVLLPLSLGVLLLISFFLF